jgi:hypothetical protein
LYVATLTGSLVYTDSDTQWTRLHENDGVHSYGPDSAAESAVRCLESLDIKVPTLIHQYPVPPSDASEARALIREIAVALRTGAPINVDVLANEEVAQQAEEAALLTFRLRASIPLNGFKRTDVSRLVLTFGRLEDVGPVRLALFLEPVPM